MNKFVASGVYAIEYDERESVEVCLNCNMIFLAHYNGGECRGNGLRPPYFSKYTHIGFTGFECLYFGYYRQHTPRME